MEQATLTISKDGAMLFNKNLLEDPFNPAANQPIISKVVVLGRTSSVQVSTIPYPRYLGPSS